MVNEKVTLDSWTKTLCVLWCAVMCTLAVLACAPANAFAADNESLRVGQPNTLETQADLRSAGVYITFDGTRDVGSYTVEPGATITPNMRVFNNYGQDITSYFSFVAYESTYEWGDNGHLKYDFKTPLSFPVEYGKYCVVAVEKSNGNTAMGQLDVYENIDDAYIDFGDQFLYTGHGRYSDEGDLYWEIPSGKLTGPSVFTDKLLNDDDYYIEYRSSSTHQSVGTTMPTAAGMYYCVIVAVEGEDSLYTGSTYSHDFVITKPISNAWASGITDRTYTGGSQMQNIALYLDGKYLNEGSDYAVSYSNNVNSGIATILVTGKGYYTGFGTINFNIYKAQNTMTAKASKKSVKVKAASVAKKKKVTKRNVKVSKAIGKISYKNVSTNKKAKKFKVNSKNGKVTVPKKTKRGTYKLKVRVTAAGDNNHQAASKTVSYKIKVA